MRVTTLSSREQPETFLDSPAGPGLSVRKANAFRIPGHAGVPQISPYDHSQLHRQPGRYYRARKPACSKSHPKGELMTILRSLTRGPGPGFGSGGDCIDLDD